MSISVLGHQTAFGTTVAIPAHQIGDLILIAARSSSETPPSVPASGGTVPSWTSLSAGGNNGVGLRAAMTIATGSEHTSGTWTGASHLIATVIRPPGDAPFTPVSTVAGGAANLSFTFPALALTGTPSTRVGYRVAVLNNGDSDIGTPPSSYAADLAFLDGKLVIHAYDASPFSEPPYANAHPETSVLIGVTDSYRAATIELQADYPIDEIIATIKALSGSQMRALGNKLHTLTTFHGVGAGFASFDEAFDQYNGWKAALRIAVFEIDGRSFPQLRSRGLMYPQLKDPRLSFYDASEWRGIPITGYGSFLTVLRRLILMLPSGAELDAYVARISADGAFDDAEWTYP